MTRTSSLPFAIRVSPSSAPAITGLNFPGSTWRQADACRFTFHSPLPAYPATYIWECLPRRQKGFYTTFFWGPDGSPGADGFYPSRTYYGAHPYPDPRGSWDAFMEPPELGPGEGHMWEIAVEGGDIRGPRVEYDRWFVQALRVTMRGSARRFHEYFVDLADRAWEPARGAPCPSALGVPDVTYESNAYEDPPSPALVWGDAPWTVANGHEVYNGILRGIRVYQEALSDADLLQEVCAPGSSAIGRSSLWYLRMNPDPADLACDPIPGRSVAGPTPVWSTTRRATLWTG